MAIERVNIGERRLVASENLRKGEKLLFVPSSLGISADSVRTNGEAVEVMKRYDVSDWALQSGRVFKEHNYLGPSGLAEDDKAAISLKATELTLGLPVSRSPVYTEKIWMAQIGCWPQVRSFRKNTMATTCQCGSNRATWKDKLCETKLKDILNGKDYVLTYEDKDGEWMRAGDVPLEMFIDVCKKLKIMKGCNAIGLVIWQSRGSEVVELVGRQLFVVDYV
uniref:Auxin-responsive protein n=2 Tax=Brassica oleracea TaxID=3712 RepID=A0A0D3CW22_BRAOL|nr:unnamed protein product [Brassica oleracea]